MNHPDGPDGSIYNIYKGKNVHMQLEASPLVFLQVVDPHGGLYVRLMA